MNRKIDEEKLFQTAIRVFARYGFNRTRMADISGELGLAAGTVYRYVKDKNDLYQKAVAFGLEQWQQTSLGEVQAYDDPLEQLVVLVLSGSQYLGKESSLLTIMIDNPSFLSISPVDDPFEEVNKQSIGIVKDILLQGVESGRFRQLDCELTAEAFFFSYMMYVTKIFIKNEGKRTWDVFLNGFEIVLQGIVHREVDEALPEKLLKKQWKLIIKD